MKPNITLLLHNIRSTHNVGSIFRTAEGFGVKEIIITGYTPYPHIGTYDLRLPHISEKLTQQIHKTALGAEEMVQFQYYERLEDWLEANISAGQPLPIIALEQSPDSILLNSYTAPDNLALLLGEEVHGTTQELLNKCDAIIEIPMVGQKESFNVSVAAGIALYGLLF